MIRFENEVLNYLNLPKIPRKEWNGKELFKRGVAIVNLVNGGQAYAVATTAEITSDSDFSAELRIIKAFTLEQFNGIDKVFVVPDYMDENIDDFDLDEQSKDKARAILEEAHEQELIDVDAKKLNTENEWVFDEIHNRDEAEAFVRAYRRKHHIKGKCPTESETLKAYLYVIASNKNRR